MTLQKRSYTAGHFELQIDGHASTAYLKSVDGGWAKAQMIDESVGPDNSRIKHKSVVEIDPFTIDFGFSGANDVLMWIQSSWRKNYNRRNGSITHGDFNLASTFEHQFFDALISETTFPALDGSSKEPAYMKIKVQPEKIVTRKASGARLKSNIGSKQKLWSASAFRLTIDGIDEFKYTNKIESFTIKQGIKKLYTGEDRFPQIEPTKIDFPNIVGTLSFEYADKLLNWYQRSVVDGQADPAGERSGMLEFLAPDRKTTLFAIQLFEVGIHSMNVQQSTANQDTIKRARFELYVGRMDLDGKGMGLE